MASINTLVLKKKKIRSKIPVLSTVHNVMLRVSVWQVFAFARTSNMDIHIAFFHPH